MTTDSVTGSLASPRKTAVISSSLGKKFLMAITGAMAFGFVVAHLIGNLLIFAGPDAINAYGVKLRELGPLLWLLRGGLLAAFVVHVITGVQLRAQNSAARPVGYGKSTTIQASPASRYMWLSGLVVLAFVLYHLAQFTFEITHPQYAHLIDEQGRHDIHSMVILGFSQWYLVTFYLLGVGLLCWHISHGVASMFQSLGLMTAGMRSPLEKIAAIFGTILFLGFASIPLSVQFGLLKLAGGGR